MTSLIAVRARCRALAAVLAAVTVLASASLARAQEQVVVLVDGEPITSLDVQQRTKFIELSTHKAPTRQEAIDSLIDQILELREAKQYGIEPTDADVDTAFANVASHMGSDPQKLTQMLTSAGASAETLKLQLKAQIAWNSLVRGRYKASLEIPDTDVEAQLQLNKPGQKQQVGYEYIMRPIILVVPHGSPATAYEARKRDADALRGRFPAAPTALPLHKHCRKSQCAIPSPNPRQTCRSNFATSSTIPTSAI